MTQWEQQAVLYIFASVIISGLVLVANNMGPVPIVSVEDSYLQGFFISSSDVDAISDGIITPEEILGPSAPSDVLGFLSPSVGAIFFIFKAVFSMFNGWSLALFGITDAFNVSKIFLAPILFFLLLMNLLAFLVILRAFKETVPFQ